jgi:hypothetical protein
MYETMNIKVKKRVLLKTVTEQKTLSDDRLLELNHETTRGLAPLSHGVALMQRKVPGYPLSRRLGDTHNRPATLAETAKYFNPVWNRSTVPQLSICSLVTSSPYKKGSKYTELVHM